MSNKTFTIAQVLTILAGTPQRIADLTIGLTTAQLHAAPGQDEWSANDVLAHLRACADVWGDCIVTILNHDHPTIRAVNPRTWIRKTDYLEQEFQPALQAFTRQRSGLLAVLEPLAPEDWLRTAIVTGAGKVLEWTVLSYARRLASHERPHVKQIQRIANSMLEKGIR